MKNLPALGQLWASQVVLVIKNLPAKRLGFNPWVRKIPWRRKWQPTPVLLPGKSHGQRGLAGYSPRSLRELDMTEQLILSLICSQIKENKNKTQRIVLSSLSIYYAQRNLKASIWQNLAKIS